MLDEKAKRQIGAILRLEWKKSFLNRRAWWIYLLALGPVLLTGGHALDSFARPGRADFGEDLMIFSGIFQLFYLRFGIFFGAVGIFANLFRGEMLERTLHYYLLSAVKREWVVVGKYLAGLIASAVVFCVSVTISYFFILVHFGQTAQEYLIKGPGLQHLLWYNVTTVLACAGYGAVFLLLGLVFRNPMIPAAIVLVLEGINAFLPSALQQISIIYYLKSLCPLELPRQPGLDALVSVSGATAPAAVAILGLLIVSSILLFLACRRAQDLEISYAE